MYKILFIGQRSNFASSLEKALIEFYSSRKDEEEQSSLSIEFIADEGQTVASLTQSIKTQKPNLVIFESDSTKDLEIRVIRFLNTLGENKMTHYASLLSEGITYQNLEDNSLTGEIIYFYKGIDHSDVFNYAISVISPSYVEKSNVAKAIYSEPLPLMNLAKVTYVARDYAKIETNSYIPEGMTSIDFPIHKEVFFSKKHKISHKVTDGTRAQFKYAYRLEFDYANAPIKKSEKDSIIFDLQEKNKGSKLTASLLNTWEEQIKASSIVIATTGNEEKKEEVKEVEEEDFYRVPPTEIIDLSKSIIANWVKENSSKPLGIQQTILVYDSSLSIMNEVLENEYSNSKRIYLKSDAEDIEKDIEKYRPSLIVLQCDEVNSVEDIKRAIASFINYRNYLPYFLIFNNPINDVVEYQHKLEYHFLISVGEQISLSFIEKVRALFEKKMIESEDNKSNRMKKKVQKASPGEFDEYVDEDFYNYKAFPDQTSVNDTFYLDSPSELVSITEHEIIFRATNEPEIGTCFKLLHPFPLYIVVVPHIEDSAENELKNCSRAIIFQMKESQKAKLRRFVNSVANLDTQSNSVLYTKEIMALKKEYFPESYVNHVEIKED